VSTEDAVLFEVDAGVARITINRPMARNALNIAANARLFECWEAVDADPGIRAAVLSSSDCGSFCAGMDLKEAAQVRSETGKDILDCLKDPMFERMRTIRKPVIAAMTGHFLAGGMVLALNSDLRVGLAGTKGGISEVKVGRGSPWAVPLLWMLPQPVLMELILTGEPMAVERLRDYGFVNYVESCPDEVRARALALASSIAAGAPLSVLAGKSSILAAMSLGCDAGFKYAKEIYKPVYASSDAQEGPRAFSEQRTPVWTGT